MTTPAELRLMVDRVARRGRRGAGVLRLILDTRVLGDDVGESELEEVFARICRDYDVEPPSFQVRVRVGGKWRRLDFAYPDRKIDIEVDGFELHSGRDAFDDDRARQNELVAAGWTVLRFTRPQLVHQPGSVARLLRSVLRRVLRHYSPFPFKERRG